MRALSSLVVLGLATACGQIPGGTPDAGTEVDAPRPPPSATCKAQRAVYLIASTGGLSWFTLNWPAPAVITGFQTGYAYDNPANAKNVTVDAAHPLYVRRIADRGLWEGRGKDPHPSVFVAGTNETHTQQPASILLNSAQGIAAAGAVLQSELAPKIAVLSFTPGGPYGGATGAPTPVSVTNVDMAVAAFRGLVPAEVEQQLMPSAAQLARYVPPGASSQESLLGSRLAFTANAMRLGLVGSVMMQAVADDPHGAFDNGTAGPRADNLAAMLDEFYRELAMSSELACGSGGAALSLADNVVTIVVGDTPKNSFANAGWGDGTPGLANWAYVRSNGFTKPGWFGTIQPSARVNFNPTTGAADAAATIAESTAAAFAGALYAIARGDKTKVRLITAAPFDGVILR